MAWRGRSRDWAERKYADYQLTKRKRQRNVRSKPYKWNKKMGYPRPVTVQSHRAAQVTAARRATAKRGLTRGAVVGAHALSGAARLGSRAIPVVGWGMLAYDLYQFGEYLADKKSLKSPDAYVDPFLFENITHHDYVQGYNTIPISVWRTM